MTATRHLVDKVELFRRIGYEPHPGQKVIHASAAKRRIVACGVRWGKTKCASMEGVAAAIQPRERAAVGWVVAPSYDLATRVFREIVYEFIARDILKPLVIALREHDHFMLVRTLNGKTCEVRAKTADNPTGLLGEGLDWLIVDEASRLKPDVWQRFLASRLIDKGGWAMLISTPKGKNYFYDLWRDGSGGSDDWKSWNTPSWDNPMLSKDAIEDVRSRIPDAMFRQEYGAEFIEGAGAVFRNVRELATITEQEPYDEAETYYAGLDLAKTQDYTVLVIIDSRRRVVAWDRFNKIDWALQVGRVAAMLKRYGEPLCVVDSTGKGEPVFEALRAADVRCVGYPFTQASKAALVNNLAILMEKREVHLPTPEAWPELVDEVESFQYSISSAGNVRASAPDGRHDDCVCALMLAAWEAKDAGGHEVYEV